MLEEPIREVARLKQEYDALIKKAKLCKGFNFFAGIGLLISIIAFLNTQVQYDLIPIDKATFERYGLSASASTFVQTDLSSIEDVFSITTYTKGLPAWENMYKYDSKGLTDSAASTYDDLKKRYQALDDQSSYSYMYAVGKTADQTPCILRLSGEDANGLNTYVKNWEALVLASYGIKTAAQNVYGRTVPLTPLSELENKETLSAEDSDFFRGRPAGMKDDAYYKKLETYPVIDLEDVAAYDKRENPASVANHNLALAFLLAFGAAVAALRIAMGWLRNRLEERRSQILRLAQQMGIGPAS